MDKRNDWMEEPWSSDEEDGGGELSELWTSVMVAVCIAVMILAVVFQVGVR